MGQRIGMDISNMIWDRTLHIMEGNDFEGCKEDFLKIFAMEVPFSAEEFENKNRQQLEDETYEKVMTHFKERTARLASTAYPTIKRVYEEAGHMYENILVPISDGRGIYQISVPLKECYDSEAKNILIAFEKIVLLHTIDEAWKENLRALDELKQSVQNASYEQKDPLLIFKLESVTLFDNMVNEINDRTISTLMRCSIPMADPNDVKQAPNRMPEAPRQRLTETKQNLDDMQSSTAQQNAANRDTRQQPTHQPIVNNTPRVGRNDPCPCGSGKKYKNCHGKGL